MPEAKMYSVVWTLGVVAVNELEAVKHARRLQNTTDWASSFYVLEDVDSRSVADSELEDRGYETIDLADHVEPVVFQFNPEALQNLSDYAQFCDRAEREREVAANIQGLLCAPWSAPEHDDYVIPAFLLKRQPETYMEIVIVDPDGIAVITHRKI